MISSEIAIFLGFLIALFICPVGAILLLIIFLAWIFLSIINN